MSDLVGNLPFMLQGLLTTLELAVCAIVLSAIFGTAFGVARLSPRPYLHYPAVAYIEAVRSIPLILLILYLYFVLVDFGYQVSPFWTGVVALAIVASSYLAEVVRSGISGVPDGQMEAARSSGLSYRQAMSSVVLPQALRRMAPALVSEFIKTVKNTSLVAVIGAYEFFDRVNITNSQLLTRPFLVFGFAAVVYFVINYSLSSVARTLELRLDV